MTENIVKIIITVIVLIGLIVMMVMNRVSDLGYHDIRVFGFMLMGVLGAVFVAIAYVYQSRFEKRYYEKKKKEDKNE